MIYEDQLAAVQKDSAAKGHAGGELDLSLLTDGCRRSASRASRSTSPTATSRPRSASSSSPTRPGTSSTRATWRPGASTCDLAIILIDARHGVLRQTRRHSFIVSLLGIKHVVVAINKMDLVGLLGGGVRAHQGRVQRLRRPLDLRDLHFMPSRR